jgi:hypothetical protein
MINQIRKILIFSLLPLSLYSCRNSNTEHNTVQTVNPGIIEKPAIPFSPPHYICYQSDSITIDGVLNEKGWSSAVWSDDFKDIEGTIKPAPLHKTRVKLIWDSQYLYIAAEISEPHIWAYLTQRDTVIFYDNDFELFIDPNGDSHGYYEVELNAANTVWDLLLTKPYRDGGKAIDSWDISGLKSAIKISGSLNNPRDIDSHWVVEMAIPLSELSEQDQMPGDSTIWRINFARVNWKTDIENGRYIKKTDPNSGKWVPEYNWVWAPQGVINMHYPEMWGYLQFSSIECGKGTMNFSPEPDSEIKWSLRTLYYAQRVFATKNGIYTDNIASLVGVGFESTGIVPDIILSQIGYTGSILSPVTGLLWIIDDSGKLFSAK